MTPVACRIAVSLIALTMATTAPAETLEKAWQLALSGSFKMLAAEEQQLAAQQQISSAKAARLPTFTVAADYVKLDNPPTVQGQFGGAPFEFAYWQTESLFYSALSSVPLYSGGRITAGIKSAEASQAAAIAAKTNTASAVKIAVARAYISVLRAEDAMRLVNSHLQSVTAHQTDASNLYRQGMVARNDVLMAEVTVANARQQALQAKYQSDIARSTYNQLLNRPLDTPFKLDSIAIPQLKKTVDQLTSLALVNRADLEVLEHRTVALDYDAKTATAITRPQINLNTSYLFLENEFQVHENVWTTNVSLLWPIFDGGVSRHRSGALQRQAAAMKAQHDELNSLIALQVRQAWLDVTQTHERIKIAGGAVAQAEENLVASRNRYQAGLISNTALLDAETLRMQAHNNHDNAVYDATLALLQLKQVVGIL